VRLILSALQIYEPTALAKSHFKRSYFSSELSSSMHDYISSILYSTLRMAFLHAHEHGTSFTILVDDNGNIEVQERLLNTKFHFKLGSIYIEEEVFLGSSEMVETILQLKFKNDEDVVWCLRSRT
jgi:hypothetical protein